MANETFKLEGAEELDKLLKEFPARVRIRASKTGLRKAGARMRTLIRRDAPRVKGNLRKAIRTKAHRNGSVSVGLKERFYYKTLEFETARGAPLHPFFEKSVHRHSQSIANLIVQETKNALYREAGKAYARSRSSLRRR